MVAPRFTRVFSITLIVALLTSSVQSATKPECPKEDEIKSFTDDKAEPKRYIVLFENPKEQNSKTEQSIAEAHFAYMKECWDKKVERSSTVGTKTSTDPDKQLRDFSVTNFGGYNARFTAKFAEMVKEMKGVKSVTEDQIMKINYAVPQNLYVRTVDDNPQKNDDRIDQAKFPLDGKFEFPDSAGKDVDLYIIDTGVRTDHQEFGKRAKIGGVFCQTCNEDEDDENGHGTHVASIAAGKTLGVARNANIIGIRVLDAEGSGSNADVIEGMTSVIELHAKSAKKQSVVNMSLGGGFSQPVNDAVDALTNAGIHVVVAAGNESQESCNTSPGSAKSAITVGATNENDDGIAFFSNFGECNDIFAPGSNILGADFKSKNGKIQFSGTSQASPHVAGTVALIIAEDGNKTPEAMAAEIDKLSTKNVVKGIGKDTKNRFLRVPEA